jgi:uncharacterized membrane protein (UPF0127 family)
MPTSPDLRVAGIWILVLLAALAACAAPPDRPRTVTLDGDQWQVLDATDDGMRGRSGFGGVDGMLFDRGRQVDPGSVFFVMDEVAFPLDIAWFDASGQLVGTTTMPTCPAEPCPRHAAPAPFRWAIEAPVGAFDELPPDAHLEVREP